MTSKDFSEEKNSHSTGQCPHIFLIISVEMVAEK
jgi:hypothetical protein